MTSWFRSWHGAPTDNSYLAIAKRAGVAPGIVSAIVWALIDFASQNVDRGSVEGFDIESYSAFSGFTEDQIGAVINALKDKGKIQENRISSWDRRQPKREDDGAAERKQKQREREKENERHAMSRSVTHTEQIQITDTEQKEPPNPPRGEGGFEIFWEIFPAKRKGSKQKAETAWSKAVKRSTPQEIIDGAVEYAKSDEVARGLQREQQRGLTTTDGRTITRNPPSPSALDRDQLTAMLCLMRRNLPGRNSEYRPNEGMVALPELTPEEREFASYHSNPAHPDVIIHHLSRLSMHKRMDSNDPKRTAYLLADFARRLDGITELEMFAMSEHFIENDVDPFFPQYAKCRDYLENYFQHSEWSGTFKNKKKWDKF